MQVQTTWQQKVAFLGESGTGHQVMMDGSEQFGGENRGARPMELLLLGLGGCASFDVVTILQKSRQAIDDVRCQITAKRSDNVPAVFTDIHLHFVVVGTDIKEKQVTKAIELSATKYCSASKMLADGGVNITHDYEIIAS